MKGKRFLAFTMAVTMSCVLLGTQVTYAEDASVIEQVGVEAEEQPEVEKSGETAEQTGVENTEETVEQSDAENTGETVEQSDAENTGETVEQTVTEKSGLIPVKPATLTEMKTGESYSITTPANKDTKYEFVYIPEKSAGYHLNYVEGNNMNTVATAVLRADSTQLAGGCGYYMLEAGKEYFFDILASSNYKAQAGSGSLTMEECCPWEECVYVNDGIATGLAKDFKIVHLPDGVKGMKEIVSFHSIGTLILPESLEKPDDWRDFWEAYYRYETPGSGGRYVAEEKYGVLYDQKDHILQDVPGFLQGTYTVKDGTVEVGTQALYGINLEEIIFPDSVKNIDGFGSNSTLKRIQLPAHVEHLDARYFDELYALEALEIPEYSEYYETRDGVLFEKHDLDDTSIKEVRLTFYPIDKTDFSYTVPDDVLELGSGSFARQAKYNEDPVRNLKYLTIPKTVRCSAFLNTSSGNDRYTELTLRGYEDSPAHKYWQEHYSYDEKIKWETIDGDEGEEKREFTLGRDNNNFIHNDFREECGFYGVDRYYLTDEDYDRLFQIPMNAGTQQWLRDQINGKTSKGWDGACFGSTVTLGLVYNGALSVSDISDSGKQSVYDLSKPHYDKEYLSTIHYYHLLQDVGVKDRAFAEINSYHFLGLPIPHPADTPPEEVTEMFEKIISYLDQGETVIMTTDNHAVLITGYEKTGDGYSFQIYDVNSVGGSTPKGEFYYMEVSSDLTEFSCPEIALSRKQQGEIIAILPENVEPEREFETAGNITNIVVDTAEKVRITNEDGKYLFNDGEEWSGDMKLEDAQFIRNTVGDEDRSELRFMVNGESSYVFSDIADNIETSVFNECGYISLSGKGIESAEVSLGEGIHLYGDDYSFRVAISTENEVAENENGLIAISGKAKGNVEITVDYDTVSVSSEKGIEEIKAESMRKNDSIQLEVPEKIETGKEENIVVKDPENPDPENPDPENPDPENPDPENPDPENPDPENPDPENPDPENPDPENPDPENPDPENPDLENPNPEKPQNDIEGDKGNNNINAENEGKENQDKSPSTGDGQGIMHLLYALGLSSATAGAIVCKRKKRK